MKSIIEIYSDIAKNNPPWTTRQEKEFLSTCINKNGKWRNNAAKERFINESLKRNLGLCFSLVKKLSFDKNSEDVFQRAVIAMVEALKKYNPQKGYKISTWITNPIRWSILQYQHIYAKNGKISDEIASYNYKHKTHKSVVSIDDAIGKNSTETSKETIANIISISNLDPNYIISRNIKTPEETIHEHEICLGVKNILIKNMHSFLNDKEIYVLNETLCGKTRTEISQEMGYSSARISQIFYDACDKIRNSPMAGSLKKLMK